MKHIKKNITSEMDEITRFLKEFPQLKSLQKLVPDNLILSEIAAYEPIFKSNLQKAQTVIPTVNLEDIFSSNIIDGSIKLENFLGHWGNVQ